VRSGLGRRKKKAKKAEGGVFDRSARLSGGPFSLTFARTWKAFKTDQHGFTGERREEGAYQSMLAVWFPKYPA